MTDWLHNLPLILMTLVVFGVTYLFAALLQTIVGMLATGELQKLYEKWITPYGVPIEGELDALFKIEAIAE